MALVCFRHPKVEAVTTCTACKEPLCAACIVQKDGAIYCSEECAVAYKKHADKVVQKLNKIRYGSGFFGTLIKFGVVVAVLYFIARYFDLLRFLPF